MQISKHMLDAMGQNDRRLKKLFSNRAILARLLQFVDTRCVEEFSFEELCSVLGETKRSSAKQDLTTSLESCNLESKAIYGRDIVFDVLTTLPFSDEVYDLCTLNLEFQSKDNPGYDLHNRALAYYCRLIDDIVNAHTGDAAYQNLHRVMSIWVISSNRDYIEHFVIRDIVSGSQKMDFMDVVLVYVNTHKGMQLSADVFDYLRTLITPAAGAYQHLGRYIPASNFSTKEATSMEGFTLGMYMNAYEDGLEKGRAESKEETTLVNAIAMLEHGITIDKIIDILDGDATMRASLEAYESNMLRSKQKDGSTVPTMDLDVK